MVFLGGNAFIWIITFLSGMDNKAAQSLFEFGTVWGLALFLHYIIRVQGFKWKEKARIKDEIEDTYATEGSEAYFSSEYSMDDMPGKNQGREDWDGVDVSVHNVDGDK